MLRAMTRVAFVILALFASQASAQPLLKSAIQVDPGNTKTVGQTFGYRLTYNCSSTSGPCLGAEVVDLLPAEVEDVSTVPASPTSDVAAISVVDNYMGTGRTRVRFQLINPLPAGNSGVVKVPGLVSRLMPSAVLVAWVPSGVMPAGKRTLTIRSPLLPAGRGLMSWNRTRVRPVPM